MKGDKGKMDAWAQLVSTTNICIEPVKIKKQKFVIGRAHDADLCLPENRLVSGHHCVIEKDSSGDVWLHDTSTNGTFLNSTNKISGKRVQLKHGDEVFIVYRNEDSDSNVAFLFQDLEELHREALETTDEADEDLDETQPFEENENSIVKPEDVKKEDISTNKRHLVLADGDCDDKPAVKLLKCVEHENISSSVNSTNVKCKKAQLKDKQKTKTLPVASSTTAHTDTMTKTDTISNHDLIAKGSQQSSFRHEQQMISTEKPAEETGVVVSQVDSNVTLQVDSNVTSQVDSNVTLLKEESLHEASTSSGVAAASNKTNDVPELLEEQMTCAICQEILYNSVSLQPCMHIFCAGCYSDWMDRSTECPTCRKLVSRIRKYHPMKNVIEAYLMARPEKQRPEEDRRKLDASDKIKKDNMKPPDPTRPVGEDEDDDDDGEYNNEDGEYDDEDGEYDGDYIPGGEVARQLMAASVAFELRNLRPPPPPPRTICRQCPNYPGVRQLLGGASVFPAPPPPPPVARASSNEPSSSKAGPSGMTTGPSAKTYPVAPVFTCSVNQNHIYCLCCMKPMPLRRNEVNVAHLGVIPPQQCAICSRAFCHQYWGCLGQCDGCLAKFADMKFRSEALNNLILQNTHESKGFRLYLESNYLTIEDVHRTCVEKLREGVYTAADDAFLLGSDFPVCYNCALKNLSHVAFEYRRDIPEYEMPVEFRGRPNCRWGRHCRTQTHNQKHSETYNHIC